MLMIFCNKHQISRKNTIKAQVGPRSKSLSIEFSILSDLLLFIFLPISPNFKHFFIKHLTFAIKLQNNIGNKKYYIRDNIKLLNVYKQKERI